MPAANAGTNVFDYGDQVVAIDGLEQVVTGAVFDSFGDAIPGAMSCQENDLRPSVLTFGEAQHFQTVDAGHLDIREEQIAAVAVDPLLCFRWAVERRDGDVVSQRRAEDVRHQSGDRRIVVYHQKIQFSTWRAHAIGLCKSGIFSMRQDIEIYAKKSLQELKIGCANTLSASSGDAS